MWTVQNEITAAIKKHIFYLFYKDFYILFIFILRAKIRQNKFLGNMNLERNCSP